MVLLSSCRPALPAKDTRWPKRICRLNHQRQLLPSLLATLDHRRPDTDRSIDLDPPNHQCESIHVLLVTTRRATRRRTKSAELRLACPVAIAVQDTLAESTGNLADGSSPS